MTTITNQGLTNLFADGHAKINGKDQTFSEVLLGNLTDEDKAQLYTYAKGIFDDAKKALSKKDDDKAMEKLVRAYTILTSKKLEAGPKAKGFLAYFFGTSELREQARMVKESKKIFADHRESYLKAKLGLVESKAIARDAKTKAEGGNFDLAEFQTSPHDKIQMLKTLTEENIQRMEPYMKEFGPKVHTLWKNLKQQLTDKKLGKLDNHGRTDTPQTAVATWNKLRTEIANSNDKGYIASVFKDIEDKDGKVIVNGDQVLTDFLTGKRNLRSLINPQNHHAARVLGQIDNLERACKGNRHLEALFHKLEVALLHQSSPKNIQNLVHQISNQSKNPAIYESIYGNIASQRPLTALNQNIDAARGGDIDTTAYQHVLNTLRDPTHKSGEKLAHAATSHHVKTPSALGIDAHTVTLGTDVHSTNTVVSAAPKNIAQAKAYFENLERNNTRIIVNLHEDYEQKMGGFELYPKNVGEEVEHGDLKIKLIRSERGMKIPGSPDNPMTVNYDQYEVKHNGKTTIYPAYNLKGLSKEDTPLDPAALTHLSILVNHGETGQDKNGNILGKGHLAITSTDGTGRAGAFLLYHEIANSPKDKPPLDILNTYFQYTRTRPPLHEKQFASVVAALAGQTEPVKSAADPAGKIASKLLETPDAKFMSFFLEHDETLAKDLHTSHVGPNVRYNRNIPSSSSEYILTKRLAENIDRKLFHGTTEAEKRRMQQEIAHFGPEALSKLFYVLTLPQNDIYKIKNNLQLLNSKHNAEFHAKFKTYQDRANPTLPLLKSRIRMQERNIPEVDLELLHRLDAVRQKVDVRKNKETNHIYEVERLFDKSRTDLIYENRMKLNKPETLIGVPVKDRQMLGKELIQVLKPAKIDQIDPSFFKDLTDEQRLAISTEQAKAMTGEQWKQFFEGIPKPRAELINKMDTETFIQLPRQYYTRYLEGLSPTKMHALVLNAEHKRPIIHDGEEHKASEVKAFIDHIRKESAYPMGEHVVRQKLLHELAIRTKDFIRYSEEIENYTKAAETASKNGHDAKALRKVVRGLQHYEKLIESLALRKNKHKEYVFTENDHVFYVGDNTAKVAIRNLRATLQKLNKTKIDTKTTNYLKEFKEYYKSESKDSHEIENILQDIHRKIITH